MTRKFWLAITLATTSIPSWSQTWTWPGCPDVTNSNFSYTVLMRKGVAPDPALNEPVKMDFDMDAKGNVDIYFVERGGLNKKGILKRYLGEAKTVKVLAILPTWGGPYPNNATNLEEGLTGIVLDPNFKTNRFIYLHWSPASAETFRVSRFTLAADTMLLNTEKILLDFPAQRKFCCHTGGAMAFDAYGDLWIGQGNNASTSGGASIGINETDKASSDEWGATSTFGLRGGIIRIHPDNSSKGYSIPQGNFGDYFATTLNNNQYRDTSKVLPEIYAKGTRNAYTLQVDPVRRWVVWGDVGPDNGKLTEEYNLLKKPAFMGWPYFAGNNLINSGAKDPSAPTNISMWNKGLKTLPAATPAIYPYQAPAAAITGPIYRYDGDLVSEVKMPPHFTRKWFVTDWNNSQINMLTLDSMGNSVLKTERVFSGGSFKGPVDFKTGPDGAFYIINYSNVYFGSDNTTSIMRISYNGTCRPTDPKLEKPVGNSFKHHARYVGQTKGWVIDLKSNRTILAPEGMVGFQLFDMMGRMVWEAKNLRPGTEFTIGQKLPSGSLQYRWIPSGN